LISFCSAQILDSIGRGGGSLTFREQIEDVISANGWERDLVIETLQAAGPGVPERIRIRLARPHASEPDGLVNDYTDGVHPLEQIQQECLRALRTGRPGI
jgi:hypothetical protein